MDTCIKVKAILQNPDGLFEDELPAAGLPAGKEQQAMLQLLAAINMQGGLARIESRTEVTFIPMCRVKEINVSIPAVVGATLGDLAAVVPPGDLAGRVL